MLLQLIYDGILKTLTYLMPEAYSEPYQISKIMTYIENLGIARTVNSGIFRHIQGHLAIFSYIQTHWGILRYIQAFVGLLYHIQTYTTLAYTTVPHSKLSYNCIVTHIKNPHIYENSLNLCNPENLES